MGCDGICAMRYYKVVLVSDTSHEFKDWINCLVELEGMHRFKEDPEWGELLQRFRNGEATDEDSDLINDQIVTDPCSLPNDLQYAVM